MHYALFKLVKKSSGRSSSDLWTISMFRFGPEPDEKWKDADNDDEKKDEKPVEVLEFVASVKSPREIAEIVRRSPLEKYILFRGEMVEVQIAMPVYVNGKSLDAVADEWA